VRRKRSTFWRYCAFVGLHGVSVPAPWSSFSVITGVGHAIEFEA
jgi:hypothetical protein